MKYRNRKYREKLQSKMTSSADRISVKVTVTLEVLYSVCEINVL